MAQLKAVEPAPLSQRYPARQPPPSWQQWLANAGAWLHARCEAYVLELADLAAAQEHVEVPEDWVFREATSAELVPCSAMAGMPVYEYRRRWLRGDLCYVTFVSGRPVNLSWLHFGPCYVRGLSTLIEAEPGECYLYNVFTDPACRGQGIYTKTQRLLIRILAVRGITRIRQVVTLDNTVPLHTLPKLGYQVTRTLRHWRVLGMGVTTAIELPDGATSRTICRTAPSSVFRI